MLVTAQGGVLKYGFTKAAMGSARYSQAYLKSVGAVFREVGIAHGRSVGHSIERAMIRAQEAQYGAKPILNKLYR